MKKYKADADSSDDEFDDLDDPPGFWQAASQLPAVWEESFEAPITSPDKSCAVSCPPAVQATPKRSSATAPLRASASASQRTAASASPPERTRASAGHPAPQSTGVSTTSHQSSKNQSEASRSRRIADIARSLSTHAASLSSQAQVSPGGRQVGASGNAQSSTRATKDRRTEQIREHISAAFSRGSPSQPVRPAAMTSASAARPTATTHAPYQRPQATTSAPPRVPISRVVERQSQPSEAARAPAAPRTFTRSDSLSSESSLASTCPPSPVFDTYPSRTTTMDSIDPDSAVRSNNSPRWTDSPHFSSAPQKNFNSTMSASSRTARPMPSPPIDDSPDPALGLPAGTTTRPMTFKPPRSVPPGVQPLSTLFGGRLARDLNPVLIAHDPAAQALLDTLDVPWGAQYELARGVLNEDWAWADVIRERLRELRGSDRACNERCAPRVREVMLGRGAGRTRAKTTRVAAFRELDLEQAALVEGKGRGLGLMGPWEEMGVAEDYFGGKIQQVVRVTKAGKGKGGGHGPFEFRLLPMQAQRRSFRLARRLGSRRILQVRLDKENAKQGQGKEGDDNLSVAEFLAQSKFVLCGRVFVPYASKDGSAYLVEVDEDYERKARIGCGDHLRLSLEKLIESENPWVMNCNQPITKWVTRFSLSFSTSIPAVEFAEENMFLIEDEYATGWDRSCGAPPAEQTMTDGCGFINRTALTQIARRFTLPHGMPTAVQGRVAGAKGMFLLHPFDEHPEPRVWIRDSQNKIKLPKLERYHRILDLLKFAQPPTPAGFDLSEQAVLNLSHNGVPSEDFATLAEDGLRERTKPLLDWDAHAAAMWKAVSDIGNVTGSRRVRGSQVMHRLVSGYRQTGSDEDLPTGDEDQVEAALLGRDPYSGSPRSVHEQIVELLQAGFRPQDCEFLRVKMQMVLKMVCDSAVDEYRVPVPDSRGLNAFVVPDPLGVLKEDQIFYKSSESFMDPETQTLVSVVEGQVIVGRYPIRLPSDLRRVTAVNIPALHQFPDVIIVPTVGKRSLVSLLSGGDCDGDILFLLRGIFTKYFINRPYSAPTPDFMTRNFEKEKETIADFCARVSQCRGAAEKQTALARVFLAELGDSKVGIYSMYHDMAIAKQGYGAKETIRIAHMFNTLLDAKKTGVRVKPEILKEDRKLYSGTVHETEKPDVLRVLRAAARETKDSVMREFAQMAKGAPEEHDDALLAPRIRALPIKALADEIAVLDAHIDVMHTLWVNTLHGPGSSGARKLPSHIESPDAQKKKGKKCQPGEGKDDMLVVTRQFARVLDDDTYTMGGEADDLPLLRATGGLGAVLAACAYAAHPRGYFAFTMAFAELCRLKARAVGDVACVRVVDEIKTIPASALPYIMGDADEDEW